MSVPEILKSIGERFQSSATVKNVFGEPISVGDRAVIPVARISYGFGGGGGYDAEQTSRGGGGGGHMSAAPVGVLEVTSAGTRFIFFTDWRRLTSIIAGSLALGFAVGARLKRSSARGELL